MKPKILSIDTSRPLRIMQMTDLHLRELPDWETRVSSERLVREAIETMKPDFIAVTGDLQISRRPVETARDFCKIIDAYQIPWGFCFGNHDRDLISDERALETPFLESPYCLYRNDIPEITGYGNYNILFVDKNDRIVHAFYFLDNVTKHRYDGMKGLECGSTAYNRWFREEEKRLEIQYTKYFNTFVFLHKPLHEFAEMWQTGTCKGVKFGRETPPDINTGLFCTFCEDKNMKAVFCGHDHGSYYSGEYHKIRLLYGRTTGFGQSRGGVAAYPCGMRICDINPDGKFKTFFYLDGGLLLDENDAPVPLEL